MTRVRYLVSTIAAMTCVAVFLCVVPANSAAIFTSLSDGQTVDLNVYDSRSDVYLNGGPQNPNGPGFPDGFYYFMVTDTSGAQLLSTDSIYNRALTVSNGVISGVAGSGGTHAVGVQNPINLCIPVQLIPFATSPSPGGEYKVWMTAVGDYNPQAANSSFGFMRSKSATDNFKVAEDDSSVPEPASILTLGAYLAAFVGSCRKGRPGA